MALVTTGIYSYHVFLNFYCILDTGVSSLVFTLQPRFQFEHDYNVTESLAVITRNSSTQEPLISP